MPGLNENDPPPANPAAPEFTDLLRSLHSRLDELQRAVTRLRPEGADAAGEWPPGPAAAAAGPARAIPAWRRRTEGEMRWPVTLTSAVAVILETEIPDRLQLVQPAWALAAAQGALGLVLVAANPRRINRESMALRLLGLTFAVLLSLASGWSVGELAVGIVRGTMGQTAGPLLITGGSIWLTNVVVFALWYWEFDRGGPVARALNTTTRYPDFQFAPMVSPPEMVSPDWEPAFVDYLYLAFTNAAAFSPTDVLPMSRTAKVGMAVQSIISIVTVALVISRAVNILPVHA